MNALIHLVRREIASAWRYRWAAVAFAWVVCLGGWLAVFTIPNQYESNARLYVDVDSVLTPLLRGIEVDSGLPNQLDMLQRTLLSRPNLERVIAKTDLDLSVNGPADLDKLVAQLATAIRLVPQARNLFTISYTSPNPRLAYDVVRTVLALFMEGKSGLNRNEIENARTFLQAQLTSYEQKLRDAEKKRADFRAKYLDLLPNDDGISGLEQARSNVITLQGQVTDAQASRDMLKKELDGTPPLLSANGPGAPVNGALLEAEQRLAELRLRYTDQYPDVKMQQALVAQLRAGGTPGAGARAGSGGAGGQALANPVYEQLKSRIFDLDGQLFSLQRRLKEAIAGRDYLEQVARGAPGLQAEFTNLDRDYNVIRRNYEELLARRESMRIAAAAQTDADNIRMQVVDPPIIPQVPSGPKRIPLLSLVLLGGIGAGVGLAVLLVRFDASFHSVDDLRSLGLPVIGGVSLMSQTRPRSQATSIASVAVLIVLLAGVYVGLLTHLNQIADRI
ncbi:MAG: hypothetical protein JOY70_01850 [Acidisphaera sp.]|nr:hypothetical protein [Acidisphaera sp.]